MNSSLTAPLSPLSPCITVVGAGLAGSEAAWQLAQQGHSVRLYEMRPHRATAAHLTDGFAELVCSNSLGSQLPDRATGLLQAEMKLLDSLIMRCALETAVPAGGALAVDREAFSAAVTSSLHEHPLVTVVREEVTQLPLGPSVIASGPLTSDLLANEIRTALGSEYLYFYDAISPIVEAETLDLSICFRASRRESAESEGDYLNCPMDRDEYRLFVEALLAAEKIPLRDFEKSDAHFFESCLPIEVLAARGFDALAYGPMRPIGLTDPRTGKRPHAVVQLRQDNLAGSLYNLVGFQTNIKWGEQERILRLIPGLREAEFIRLGQMHRNTYINSPTLLDGTMQLRSRSDLFFAGQIVGVEGYAGNAASGLLAGINLSRYLSGKPLLELPRTTMMGALFHYVSHTEPKDFQPMKANYGIMPELSDRPRDKFKRYAAYSARALEDLRTLLKSTEESVEKLATAS